MEQNYQCKFCKSKFHRESTLTSHMCVKKRRYIDINTAGSRLGYMAYRRFYEISAQSKTPKTQDDFINSPYYIDFAKFGNHLALLKPLYIDRYIDFVIKNGVNLKDWTKDFVYDLYVQDLVKKEPAESATERTIIEISEWCEVNKVAFCDFFKHISANEASHLIRTGRISPWVLYLSGTGDDLVSKFSEDHNKIIGDIIDPKFWMKKFKSSDDDVEHIRFVLEAASL